MVHLSLNLKYPKLLRYCLWISAITASTTLSAQVQKGQIHLGGQFYTRTTIHQYYHFETNIQVNAGLMLSPKWSVGLGLPITSSTGRNYHIVVPGVMVFGRRYIDLSSNFFLILHAQLSAKVYFPNKEFLDFSANFSPSINYFISPRFGVEASFLEASYSFYNDKLNNITLILRQSTQFGVSGRPSFTLRYYFPKKGSDAIAISSGAK